MPLQNGYFVFQDELIGSDGLLNLVQILESDRLKELRHTNTTTISRLINVYPGTPQINRPSLIRRIMQYYWKNPYQDEILKKMEEFERYLLALGKREHFIHQFEVMLLGLNFLDIIVDKTSSPKARFGFDEWIDVFYTWTIAAMGHDFGYPYQVVTEMLNTFSSLYKGLSMHRIGETMSAIAKQTDLLSEFELSHFIPELHGKENVKSLFDIKRFIKELIKYDLNLDEPELSAIEERLIYGEDKASHYLPNHGYVSALMICQIVLKDFFSQPHLDSFDHFIHSIEYRRLQMATSAISTHDLSFPSFNLISYQKNPFGFLPGFAALLSVWPARSLPNPFAAQDECAPRWHRRACRTHGTWTPTPRRSLPAPRWTGPRQGSCP